MGHSEETVYYDENGDKTLTYENVVNEPLRAIIPNDNASFTVYDLPIPIVNTQKSLADGESGYDDPQKIIPLWLNFFNKMIAPVKGACETFVRG